MHGIPNHRATMYIAGLFGRRIPSFRRRAVVFCSRGTVERRTSAGKLMTSENRVFRTADTSAKSDLRNTWEKAAPGWAKWERELSAGLSAATDTLINMAGIRPGMRVLDLACGAGSQTIHVAKRVGPSGSVVPATYRPPCSIMFVKVPSPRTCKI